MERKKKEIQRSMRNYKVLPKKNDLQCLEYCNKNFGPSTWQICSENLLRRGCEEERSEGRREGEKENKE